MRTVSSETPILLAVSLTLSPDFKCVSTKACFGVRAARLTSLGAGQWDPCAMSWRMTSSMETPRDLASCCNLASVSFRISVLRSFVPFVFDFLGDVALRAVTVSGFRSHGIFQRFFRSHGSDPKTHGNVGDEARGEKDMSKNKMVITAGGACWKD